MAVIQSLVQRKARPEPLAVDQGATQRNTRKSDSEYPGGGSFSFLESRLMLDSYEALGQ